MDAVFVATPSKIVLTDPVSEFKEPVVRSISSARNISEPVAAEADKFALFANPRANICEPLDAKSDFVVASLLAEVCVLEAASKIFTCEPLAANEADDLACDADVNNDDVANNIDAVFVATPSNTVLIEPVSAFKEPVVTSMESARNISEAESAPTLLNLVLKEPVANPNELDTSARTTDDDLNAPPANNDADVSAPCPNNAPDASAPSPNSFATAAPDTTAPSEKSISEPVCSLVNSKLAE